MKSIRLRAPAKLNLFLKVINKREDNYHNLVTLFERISLSDDIKLTLNRTGKIRVFCSHPDVPTGPKNLGFRAAQLLREDFRPKCGVDIHIRKNIPVAAGLGGGSSDAASVLLGLNKLWDLHLTGKELLPYAQRIGSDVPFFIYNHRWALGTQRGDLIKKADIALKLWHVLVVPRIKVYTKDVFEGLESRPGRALTNILTKSMENVNILIRALQKKDFSKVQFSLVNDLEPTVFRLHPNLSGIKTKLRQLDSKGALLSGSGPSIFGLAPSRSQAQSIKKILKKHYKQVFVVCTL